MVPAASLRLHDARDQRRPRSASALLRWTAGGQPLHSISDAVLGDWHRAMYAAVKVVLLFATAVVFFRVAERRTIAMFAPFDWVAAVATGAIVGRTATATDATWLTGAAALGALLATHACLARLRFLEPVRRLVDPPLRVLARDGRVERAALSRCGMTEADLRAALRAAGHPDLDRIHLVLMEPQGKLTVTTDVGCLEGSAAGPR